MGLTQARRAATPAAMAGQDLFEDQQAFTASHSILLDGPTDLDGFRRAARRLLAQQARPEWVSWYCRNDGAPDLFAGLDFSPDSAFPGHTPFASEAPKVPEMPTVMVPAEFLQLCQNVILHNDAGRFGLLYRLFWRLSHEPDLRHDALDADWVQAQHMAQAVRRDMHKMKAFVRFRTVQDETFKTRPEGGPLRVAWFEPEHHIVQAIAPFFARRFTQMRWAILTPECSVDWNGTSLRFGPGALKADAPPADAGEHLWLTYYQNTFNPARLKLKAMQKEMPRRYWKNLPEAQFISALAARAAERRTTMIEQPPTVTRRRISACSPDAAGTRRS
jgi:uracil-DNA glycosylase